MQKKPTKPNKPDPLSFMENSRDEASYGYATYVYMVGPPAIYLEYRNGSHESMLHILYSQRIRM